MIFIEFWLFFNVILFSITAATEIQDQIDRLSRSIQEKILTILLSASSSLKDSLVDSAENWCCKIDPGVQATSKTRQKAFYVHN